MKSILKNEDTKLIVLVKRNKNKKFRVKFRFYRLEKDGVTELASKVAPSLGRIGSYIQTLRLYANKNIYFKIW